MPWYANVLLAVIPAAVTGLFMWLAASNQSRATIQRLEKELTYERDKEQRYRIREIKSEPLLIFRNELASMTQKYTALIKAQQLQHTHSGISDDTRKKILENAETCWNSYYASGDYEQALLKLTNQEIIDAAQSLWHKLAGMYVDTADGRAVFKELEEIQPSVTTIQSLIDCRLKEL